MILPEIKNLHKNDYFRFRHDSNEEKDKTSKEGDTSTRSVIQNKIARKVLEKNSNKEESSSKSDNTNKKACLCSPTTHVGSFRCRLHRTSSSRKWTSLSLRNHEQPKDDNNKSMDCKSVRTVSSGNHGVISRFGRTACDNKVSLTMASSKFEQVK